MRSESGEERGLQKATGPPSFRIENEYNPEAMPQYFQISVGILEGRNYTWLNPRSANSFVVVALGNKKYRTSIKRNKQEPHYRERFSFEMFATIHDLQRSTLCLNVMEARCCAPPRVIGEANINLGTIWRQPYHRVFRKWAQLSLPREPAAGSVGFLKVGLCIACRDDLQRVLPYAPSEAVEVNYLMTSGSEQQHANFIVTVHGAFGLPSSTRHQNDRHHGAKPPNTFVRVLFCGLQAKTAVQSRTNNPMYCEQVSMVEMFPNTYQTFCIEVCSMDTYSGKILASTFLNLDDISHDGENGFLPTFGPSLLPMYGAPSTGTLTATGDRPHYRGSLLLSLNTIVPYYQQSLRSVSVEPVSPVSVENLWTSREFCIFCPIFEVSMLDSRVASHFCGVAVTIGEIPTGNTPEEEYSSMVTEIRSRKLHYTGPLDVVRSKSEYGHLDFSNTFPVLQAITRLPDYRDRIFRNNAIAGIVDSLEAALTKVERRLKSYDYSSANQLLNDLNDSLFDVSTQISKFLDNFSDSNYNCDEDMEQNCRTELDKKQLLLQIEQMKHIQQSLSRNLKSSTTATRKLVKTLLTEGYSLIRQLKKLIYKATEGWPDVVVWLLNDGSRVGFCKISAGDIMFADAPELCGRNCGKIQTTYFKPLKCSRHVSSLSMGCFCVVGKVELLAWMGLHEQTSAFEHTLPSGCKLKIKDFDMCVKCNEIMVECRVFVHKARVYCNNMGDDKRHMFLRINTLSCVKESKVIDECPTPVWNQLIKIRKMIFTSSDRLIKYPPVVHVEVNVTDLMTKTELVGSFQIDSVVDHKLDYNEAPKLQWHDMYKGLENTGKVYISVQLLQIPETTLKTTLYNPVQESLTNMRDFDDMLTEYEPLPSHLIPRTSTYKVDVYWWGFRNINVTKKPSVVLEIDDHVVRSDVIADKKINCNFHNARVSNIIKAALHESFSPINIKLYDNCTFGRTVYVGTKTVKKSNKFFVNWYPKVEREASLNRISIMSADFIKVNQTLFVKKRNSLSNNGEDHSRTSDLSSSLLNIRSKRSCWKKLFRRKELDEEEYTLLPVLTKKDTENVPRKVEKIEQNWWGRYVTAQKNCTKQNDDNSRNNLTIYDSELENQVQFSKFKDWCATLKLYSGKKTGVPVVDEQLQCGFLKAGIAIYKWPPGDNCVAVSASGVDLNKGFFSDFPNNKPAKFLTRVYIVKGMNLMAKDFVGKTYPYVVISCGGKNLGDRNSHIPNTFNPIFGTVYEVRCTLPDDYQLMVSLYNYDMIEPDELIGTTTIDLEDRIYSKHRARVGLASQYNLSNAEKWRDCVKPTAILEDLCAKNHLPPPSFPDTSTVVVNGVQYRDNDQVRTYTSALEHRENVCLSLLRNWESLPICGFPLVPEHVETRSLYNPEYPGVEQGKLHMWIDIFPIDTGINIPPCVDITPNRAEEYELRVTIFYVELICNDTDHIESKPSKLFIRAWTGFADEMQSTDCRSVSSDGHCVFNRSMTFKFKYEHTERKLGKNERNQFADSEENVPPILMIQLIDDDYFSLDEPIGCLVVNLNEVPQGVKDVRSISTIDEKIKKIDLFSTNSIHAWWPLQMNEKYVKQNYVGAIELQLVLLPKQKVLLMPAGLEKNFQSSSTRIRQNSSQFQSLKNFFYKHNALWGSLTGITIIVVMFFLTIYFVFVYL